MDGITAPVARVEVRRALWRMAASRSEHVRADAVVDSLLVIRVDDAILARAASLKSRDLRALDAIHLAAALTLGDDPEAFITYQARLARAAECERLPVMHPGAALLE